MRWFNKTAATLTFAAGLLAANYADAQQFIATPSGLQEVPPVLSSGTGTLTLALNQQTQTATYSLTYGGTFSSDVTAAHIDFAGPGVAGGILAYLCAPSGASPTPPTGTPTCPSAPTSAPLTGTLSASNIVADPTQNVAAGDFGALTTALLSGAAYVSIDTADVLSGEIRGQLQPCHGFGHHGNCGPNPH
jgi:hypothetical protein